jgi:hypothetical protein
MVETYKVESLSQALKLARSFQRSGKYNLFRGQAKNWDVVSTGRRLPESDYEKKAKVLERLMFFMDEHKSLSKYKSSIDWFFAVAQHYGFATNYIDFTMDYKVAAYFATHSKENKVGEDCVIVCLNEDDFNSLIDFTSVIFKNKDFLAPYIAKINVDNLWRLQAQKGLFLFTPTGSIEEYYKFDRIIFPFNKRYNTLSKKDIYPSHKSELELLMDQFFELENRLVREKRFQDFITEIGIEPTKLPPLRISQFFKKLKVHKSWRRKSCKVWEFSFVEYWEKSEIRKNIKFTIKENEVKPQRVKELIESGFKRLTISKESKVGFDISIGFSERKKIQNHLNRNCSILWNGCRNLPFDLMEIKNILSDYIYLQIQHGEEIDSESFRFNYQFKIDMSYRSLSKSSCLISAHLLNEAARDDLYDVIYDDFQKLEPYEIFQHLNKPKYYFDFNKLLSVFKKELIVNQMLEQCFDEKPVIFFSPAQIDLLGLS